MIEFPKRIELELVSDCNLRCTYCPRHYLNGLNGYIDFALFKKIIDEAGSYEDRIIVLHRRGESLLHENFVEMCAYVKGKFGEIQIATNGTCLTDEKSLAIINSLTFISFSIDVAEVYNKTRYPAKYETVEEKIMRFLHLNKNRVKTQVSMVQTNETNPESIDEFIKTWQNKVDRVRIYQEHSKNGKFGSLTVKRAERKPCVMPGYEILIYCDGMVGRCNHDWNGDPMGDVNKNSLLEIWHNSKYTELRNQHKTLIFTDKVCQSCDSWYPEIGIQGTGETIGK